MYKNQWAYAGGYKFYFGSNGKRLSDVSSVLGKQSSYVIKVNKQANTVTVYAKDGDNGYIIPVKAFICSTGADTPTGTYYTPAKYRWHELMGSCYGQWCTRITGGVLFHSVYYLTENDNTSLSVSAYNKLGTTCSHGCVRLTAGDAKWIYDNCSLNTTVIIYNSSVSGPFGKPSAYTLSSGHTWDPTDPNVQNKCKKNGCH
jgi:lipoprotein-anchoring transpeptidase ErfK/SrfK